MRRRHLFAIAASLIMLATLAGSTAAASVSLVRVAGGYTRPVHVTIGGATNHLYVVEQDGRIMIPGHSWPFLDIRGRVRSPADGGGGEQGLLGLAFHPHYARAGTWGYGRFYVNYTDNNGDTVIAEYRRSTRSVYIADTTERRLMHLDQPYANHNGGMLVFGRDGYLYIATGDGGGAGDPGNNAQDRTSLLGKILRINVQPTSTRPYYSPSTNPFIGSIYGRDEVWSYGLRNPWRFSFDRSTGDLYIGDVGQGEQEEIDRSRADTSRLNAGRGRNYGWNCFEGNLVYRAGCSRTGKTFPIAVYATHTGGSCSVTGGYVYRGSRYPALSGRYIFGDFCSGRIWSLSSTGGDSQTPVQLADTSVSISSFGQDLYGELYVTDLSGGGIYRIAGS